MASATPPRQNTPTSTATSKSIAREQVKLTEGKAQDLFEWTILSMFFLPFFFGGVVFLSEMLNHAIRETERSTSNRIRSLPFSDGLPLSENSNPLEDLGNKTTKDPGEELVLDLEAQKLRNELGYDPRILLDGGGGGGGGGPNDDDAGGWFTAKKTLLLLFFLFYLVLFLSFTIYVGQQIFTLPYIPHWGHHYDCSQSMKKAPLFVYTTMMIANYAPQFVKEIYFTPEVYSAFVSGFLSVIYILGVYVFIPSNLWSCFRRENSTASDAISQYGLEENPSLRIRSMARYVLAVIAFIVVSINAWLLIRMLPQTFALRPDNWADIMWFKGSK